MTSSKPNYLPSTHLQMLSHWGLGLQHMNVEGDTDAERLKPSPHFLHSRAILRLGHGGPVPWVRPRSLAAVPFPGASCLQDREACRPESLLPFQTALKLTRHGIQTQL